MQLYATRLSEPEGHRQWPRRVGGQHELHSRLQQVRHSQIGACRHHQQCYGHVAKQGQEHRYVCSKASGLTTMAKLTKTRTGFKFIQVLALALEINEYEESAVLQLHDGHLYRHYLFILVTGIKDFTAPGPR